MSADARDIVAGVGFRHCAEGAAIVALTRRALEATGLPAARLRLLATAQDRAAEAAFREAAALLGVPGVGLPPEALRAVDDRVPTRSARIEAQRGVGSLAEAAALAAGGRRAVLVLPRIVGGEATCALALVPVSA